MCPSLAAEVFEKWWSSGLAAAYKLRKSGVRVTVFEAADRAGGKIRSNSESGFLWDEGANTMVSAFFVVHWESEVVLVSVAASLCSGLWH